MRWHCSRQDQHRSFRKVGSQGTQGAKLLPKFLPTPYQMPFINDNQLAFFSELAVRTQDTSPKASIATTYHFRCAYYHLKVPLSYFLPYRCTRGEVLLSNAYGRNTLLSEF